MRRRSLAVLLLAGAMALGACGDDDDGVVNGPAQEAIDNESPYGPGVEVGETYDYDLYTHCGVQWARIDGVWWQTTPLNDGGGNPPGGWGNPYDVGELRVVDEGTAVYSGGPGVDVEFERTDLVEAPFTCE